MSLCDSIDTLAMAYLDDELAVEERHELETHLTECGGCRVELDAARADQDMIQGALVAPRASDSMRMRLARQLDGVDRDAARDAAQRQRQRWSQWVLPGSAIMAAAAAILVFVGVNTSRSKAPSAIERAAVHQQSRSLPLEVTGDGTEPWIRQNFASMEVPRFAQPGSRLLGGRLLPGGINGHDAALLNYDIQVDGQRSELKVVVIDQVTADDMADGDEVQAGDRTVHVLDVEGVKMVTYVDASHRGFVFADQALPITALVGLVGRTHLVGPQQ